MLKSESSNSQIVVDNLNDELAEITQVPHFLNPAMPASVYELDEQGLYLIQLRQDIQGDEVMRCKAMIHELNDLISYFETRVANISPDVKIEAVYKYVW